MTLMIDQSPSEILDYEIDWATRGIGTDTISTSAFSASSSEFTVSNPQIVASPSTGVAAQATLFFLTGGIPGSFYYITNTIVTAGGRTMQETVTYECLNERAV